MKVLFVSAEVAPFAKTGGLGDVAGSLPLALKRLGIDIRIAMPGYPCIADAGLRAAHHDAHALIPLGEELFECHLHTGEHQGLPLLMVRNHEFFMRSGIYGDASGGYPDNGERFGLFCRALLRLLPQIDFRPDIIHLNDWHSALIAVLLRNELATLPFFEKIRTLLTIHNLAYNGHFATELVARLGLAPDLASPERLGHDHGIALLKGGILFSDRVNTVSPSYAAEICRPASGHGLDATLRHHPQPVSGILNGIDTSTWDPQRDGRLATCYSAVDLRGKTDCKRALQQELGLELDAVAPVCGMVSRLTHQKGLDLVAAAVPGLLRQGAQLVILGEGDAELARQFTELSRSCAGRVAFRQGFDETLAHRIYAGSDLFLMPSRFEPCGLAQQIALRYGSVPLVHRTGGLADTVSDVDRAPETGNGFCCDAANTAALQATLERALSAYRSPRRWNALVRRGMQGDYSWNRSAVRYRELYQEMTGETR